MVPYGFPLDAVADVLSTSEFPVSKLEGVINRIRWVFLSDTELESLPLFEIDYIVSQIYQGKTTGMIPVHWGIIFL